MSRSSYLNTPLVKAKPAEVTHLLNLPAADFLIRVNKNTGTRKSTGKVLPDLEVRKSDDVKAYTIFPSKISCYKEP